MFKLDKLKQIFQSLDLTRPIAIGYSGGVDSHVLLHALKALMLEGLPLTLQAIHVNHHLNLAADWWVAHCQTVCDALDITLTVLDIHLKDTQGESLEALARTARYEVIAAALPEHSYFLTAHHQDDQAETVLLQLLRGAGPKGLSAMPFEKTFKHIRIIRPLLGFTREMIVDYAHQHHLTWIEDSSNVNTNFQRNYLRQEIMPLLKKTWPSCTQTLARSAEHCAEIEWLGEVLAEQDYKGCVVDYNGLAISLLQSLSVPRLKRVIRYWLVQQGLSVPPTIKLRHIITDMLPAKVDAQPLVTWSGVEVRRYRDVLYAMKPLSVIDVRQRLRWDLSQELILPGDLGVLTVQQLIDQGVDVDNIRGAVEVRFRQGGETCCLANRIGTHTLKNLFQEWAVPTWRRDRVPLIYYQNQLVCVVGFCVCILLPL